ncbi:hypothetical protein [Methanobacterium subterraneum]|uniref:Uncharacterized protein n=1 Tax=Methanobacterium subterraneum TaxID=59277 RepID=A0A7K4DM21_9EURY|nr:hypothetical protein [Methanobacterium subterraneum]NMO09501.1 hypothetical protein [Methanobacterium subterraneum]
MDKFGYSWERLLDETSKQFEAFCIYRDIGPGRSIQKVAQKRAGSGGLSKLKEWSSKHHWSERAKAYDAHIDEIRRSGHEDEIIEMAERHAREAKLFQDKVHERLETIDPAELKPHELIKWYETAVKIERLSLGVPTENVRQEKELKEVKPDAVTREKLQDPQVRKRATEFIKAIADSQSRSDRISPGSK